MKTLSSKPVVVCGFVIFLLLALALFVSGAHPVWAQGEGTPTDTPVAEMQLATSTEAPPTTPTTETPTAAPPTATDTATAPPEPVTPTSAPAPAALCFDPYEPDAPYGSAKPIQLTEQQYHTFSAPDDEDWVLFSAPVGMQIAIYVRDLGPDVDTRLELYRGNADGTLGPREKDSNFDPVLPLGSRIDYTIPAGASGPFYVRVTNLTGIGNCATSYTLILDGSLPPAAPTATPTQTPRVEVRGVSTNPQAIRARQTFELSLVLQNVGTASATNLEIAIPASGQNLTQGAFIPVGSSGVHFVSYLGPGQAVTVRQQLQFSPGATTLPAAQTLTVEIKWDGRICPSCTQSLSLIVYPGDDIKVPTRMLDLAPSEPNIIVRRNWTARAGTTEDRPVPVVQGVPFELVVELHNIGPVEARDVAVEFPLAGIDAKGTPTANTAFIPVESENRKWLIVSMPPDGHALVSQTLQPINVATPPPGGFPYAVAVNYSFVSAGIQVRAAVNHTVGIDVHSQPGLLAATVITPPSVGANEIFAVLVTLQDISGVGTGSAPVISLLTNSFVPVDGKSLVRACSDAVAANKSCSLEYKLVARPGLAPGPHLVPMEFTYLTKGFTRTEQRQDIRIVVTGPTPTPGPSPGPGTPAVLPGTGIRNVTLDPAVTGEGPTLDQMGALLLPGEETEGSLVVLDSYEVEPLVITPGQPFNLTLTLHNIGNADARQVMVTWGDEVVAPLGVGRVRYAGDFAAGEAALLQGQFILTNSAAAGTHILPLLLVFTTPDGRTVERVEDIALMVVAASDDSLLPPPPSAVVVAATPLPTATPIPGEAPATPPTRPFWLRLIRALLGLGD